MVARPWSSARLSSGERLFLRWAGRDRLGERPLLWREKAGVPGLASGRTEKEKGKVSPEMPQEEDGAQASSPLHSQSQEAPSSPTRPWGKK